MWDITTSTRNFWSNISASAVSAVAIVSRPTYTFNVSNQQLGRLGMLLLANQEHGPLGVGAA